MLMQLLCTLKMEYIFWEIKKRVYINYYIRYDFTTIMKPSLESPDIMTHVMEEHLFLS